MRWKRKRLPAVFCRQADKITLTLAEGSQNTITARGEAATEDDEALDAAVYSKADMVINGGGSLLVTSDMHGILSKDDMIVTGGTLEIDAGDDGLRGKDAVEIGGGTLTIRALGDGVKANNDSDPERGYVSIDGGSLTVESEQDGVQAETTLQITGRNRAYRRGRRRRRGLGRRRRNQPQGAEDRNPADGYRRRNYRGQL